VNELQVQPRNINVLIKKFKSIILTKKNIAHQQFFSGNKANFNINLRKRWLVHIFYLKTLQQTCQIWTHSKSRWHGCTEV